MGDDAENGSDLGMDGLERGRNPAQHLCRGAANPPRSFTSSKTRLIGYSSGTLRGALLGSGIGSAPWGFSAVLSTECHHGERLLSWAYFRLGVNGIVKHLICASDVQR